ncbi:GlxA family transcriptional regulator [Nocardia pseudobrasiliensis]|uniref:AraC family transcriptional regulator with amidase-like domain n=1 Tax=Nocardia pseudobrasiliensis TaxID=45979 RepID=A0A370I1Y4_9NOCA|nr:helix-turn-helix domain-containing protein [Nocardia pseudobrasiliensis]RDI64706.1 AraC family transcriptional regulator with amidase-like domain [Nocardia pseudobrasiliensis]
MTTISYVPQNLSDEVAADAPAETVVPQQVAVLALEPVIGFDTTIPPTVLGSAETPEGAPLYEVRVCGLTTAPVMSTMGYALVPQAGPEALATADMVIVPGTQMPEPRRLGTVPPDLAEALGSIRDDARIVSICTGAFVLAAAGLLDGRRATTHWSFADDFRRLFPKVRMDENLLFVEDGNICTAAGLAAGIDLCLHLLRTDHGSEVANKAARYCVVPPWREGGQSQFIDRNIPEDGSDGTAPTRAWALRHLDQDLDLASLAAHARMSVRTFTRRFKAETGLAPGAWLLQQRLRHAQRLLESTDLPIDEVARAAGMGTASSLRHHMRAGLGIPPLTYRKTFRAAPKALAH